MTMRIDLSGKTDGAALFLKLSNNVPPNGKGNAPAGFPGLAGQHADYIAAQLRAYRKGYEDETGRTNDGDTKIMRSTAFGLSDNEIDAVASYISGLK